jgi:PAS domain S-box-containing protein
LLETDRRAQRRLQGVTPRRLFFGTRATRRGREQPTTEDFLEYLVYEGPVVMFRERLADPPQLVYVSPNLERVLGVSAEGAVASERFLAGLLAPDHREAFTQGVRAAAAGKIDRWYGEYQTTSHHGSDGWVAIEAKVQSDDRGEPEYLLGYVLDVSDRVEAAGAALEAERRYQQLFEGVPTGMISTTTAGRIIDANHAMAAMLGFDSVLEFIDETPDIGMIYADPGERVHFLETIRQKGSLTDFEVRFKRTDGDEIDVAINARMLFDGDGAPLGLEGTVIDVTARRRAEREAQRARAEADRANQAKSIFLSRMSHELRTPLNSIIGFGQLLDLSQPPLDDRSRESVRHILKAGRHLLDLIDEALDIARVEAGRLNMSLEPVATSDALAECVDLMRPLAATRNIGITIADDPCGDHVLADRQRLKQVFLNLLSNAVKYNQSGGRVDITCTRTDGHLSVSFTDTGPGVTADQLDRLFTPFDRLGAEQTDQQGTGLGLVLSRHLTEAMGGVLSVESTPGQGSTFTVSLPRIEPHDPGDSARTDGPSVRRSAGAQRTVLYIEDNLANLRLIERILALRPHVSLQTSMQGRLGLDLARQHAPDLILLDLNLPDIAGRDVLLELRADPATRPIPVVVISADASPGQVQRLLDAGANGYVTKPVDVVELLERVDELLG